MDPADIPRLIYLLLLLLMVAGWAFVGRRQNLNRMLQQALLWLLLFGGLIALYGLKDDLGLNSGLMRVRQDAGADVITLRRATDGHFYASANIDGQDIEFIVDTGASNIVITRRDARRLGIDPDSLVYVGRAYTANGPVRTAPIRLKTLRFGPFTDRNVRAWVTDGQMEVSLLGMDYLRRFSEVTIRGEQLILRR